ncbi:MAG: SprT family zinc-dependent metalloprotease [Pseudomonadota bacterium]
MSAIVLPGTPPIEVMVTRRAQARRMTLRVSPKDRLPRLTLPRSVSTREAQRFLREKESWLRGALESLPHQARVEFGSEIMLGGQMMQIVPGVGRSVDIRDGALHVPGSESRVAARVKGYLKAQARTALHRSVEVYAARLGREYARISIKDTRSRWGSCSTQGNLNFSWRLIMAPQNVLDYVAAHEVAHLAEMNHSPAFWAQVHRIFGPYEAERRWLRREGGALHRYEF